MSSPVSDAVARPILPEDSVDPSVRAAFKANEETGLLKLPMEIRDNILAYAVTEDREICPHQVEARSNRFLWEPCELELCKLPDCLGRDPLEDCETPPPGFRWSPNSKPLTVTEVRKTCRRLYDDLQRTRAFYRENTFSFCLLNQLHRFLAALPPASRHAIRHIQLQAFCSRLRLMFDSHLTAEVLHPAEVMEQNRHLFALLGDCKELRCLNLTSVETWGLELDMDGVMDLLSRRRRLASLSLCNLTVTQISLSFPGYTTVILPIGRRGAVEYVGVPGRSLTTFENTFLRCMEQAYTQQWSTNEEPVRLAAPTSEELQSALRASMLDFVGIDRVSQQVS
ncbi:hypothetical protein F4780DRAFT_747735 [Xylariomycetidae sp. FL0641]|nr:hypothetical protein F4780DRAFT_747735 [Xylariomycetidae sp. FL0641]